MYARYGVRAGLLPAALVGLLSATCAVRYATEPLATAPDASMESPPDAGTPPDAAEVDALVPLATVPPRPSAEDDTGLNLSLMLAAEWLSLDPVPSETGIPASEMSFDLDGVNTCPGPPSCLPPEGVAPEGPCDGLGGRDNAVYNLIERYNMRGTGRVTDGSSATLMFSVEDYNGGHNDRQVTVRVYTLSGTQRSLPDGGGPNHDGGSVAPRFDGTDYWRVDQSQLSTSPPVGTACEQDGAVCSTSIRDTAAYVADGVLVSSLDVPVVFREFGPKLALDLRKGRLVGRLHKGDAGLWRLDDAQLLGRTPSASLVRLFSAFDDRFSPGKPFCAVPGDFALLKKILCEARDIPADPARDGKPEPCSGLSIVFLLRASAARLGTVSQAAPPAERCPADVDYTCP